MNTIRVESGVLLEDAALSVEDLSRACSVTVQWVVERVESGLLECSPGEAARFSSAALRRARRLRALETGFEATPELAALTVDLIEEVERLRALLR